MYDPAAVMMHVLNGDATRVKLERAALGGRLTVWADALHERPVPDRMGDDELTAVRARDFARQVNASEDCLIEMARGWNTGLPAIGTSTKSSPGSSTTSSITRDRNHW